MVNVQGSFIDFNYYDNVPANNRTKCTTQNNNNSLSFCGWHPETNEKNAEINKIIDVIKAPDVKKIAISGHVCPDGDCIGAGFALANILQKCLNKKIDYFVFGDLPKQYLFLNANKNINVINIYQNKTYKADKLIQKFGKYDVAIAVDVALKRLLPDDYYDGIFSNADKTIRIDHHPHIRTIDPQTGCEIDSNFATYNYTDTDCASAAQVVMQFTNGINKKEKSLPIEFYQALYTGILTDTQNFKYAINEKPMEDAVLLIQHGVKNIDIQKKLNGEVPICIHRLRKCIYNNIRFTPDKKIAYLVESDEMKALIKEAQVQGFKNEATGEIMKAIESLTELKNVEIAFKFTGTTISVRSKNTDISKLAVKYGGGGHKHAAGFCIKKDKLTSQEDIINKIISEYQQELRNKSS